MAKIGRPTGFRPEYTDKLIKFFSTPQTTTKTKTFTTKAGTVIEEEVKVPEKIPTFERFAENLKTSVSVLAGWCDRFPAFKAAFTRAKQLQKDYLIQNGIANLINPAFSIFVAKNITDMKDQTTVDHAGLEDALRAIRAKRKVKSPVDK